MSYPYQQQQYHHHHHHQPKYLVVQVPFNVYPGQTFEARAPSGNLIQVTAPIGSLPGSNIEIFNPEYQEPEIIVASPAPAVQTVPRSQTIVIQEQQPQPYIQPVIIENTYIEESPYYNPYAASAGFVTGAAAGAIITEEIMFNNNNFVVAPDPFATEEVIISSNTGTDVIFY